MYPRRLSQYQIEPLESRLLLSATELVRNGGFAGTVSSADWVRSGFFQADSRFGNYHNGPGYAYLSDLSGNSANSISGTLYQQITIPSVGTSLTLNFWTKITTSESTTTNANDTMVAQIMDSTGTSVLQTLTTYSNLNASSSYVQRTFFINRALMGQTVRVYFSAATDAALPTTFRIDDVSFNSVAVDNTNRVVGYLPNSRYSYLNQLDLTALTHINYAFASLDTGGNVVTSGWVTTASLDGTVAAAHAAGDTVSITFYSATSTTYPQSEYPVVAASAAARANFASQAVAFCLQHNLDGIDIDWEPPYSNNNPNYGALIDALYTAGHSQHLLISAAVNPFTNEIPAATVNSEMDWLNVMCYEFAPGNFSTYNDSVSGMVDWTKDGVQKNKLLMGVPFYGKSGTTFGNAVARTDQSILANYVTQFGTYPAPNVDSYTDSNGNVWYWNGVMTMEKKAAYIRDNGYGGMMIWELSQDHWDANSDYDQYSLLPVIKSIMMPPTWLIPNSGSQFQLVNNQFFIHAGTATINTDVQTLNPNLNVNVWGGSLILTSAEHFASLNLTGGTLTINTNGGRTLVTNSLSITSPARLNLTNNSIIVNYAGSSPINTIRQYLLSGRGKSDGFDNDETWNGPTGIISTTAGMSGVFSVGYADNSALPFGSYTSFGGQNVGSSSLLIKYTRSGDTNLNGIVDDIDVQTVANNYHQGPVSLWALGDMDYNGGVDDNDVQAIINNYNPLAIPLAMAFGSTDIPADGIEDPFTSITTNLLTDVDRIFP